MPRASTANSPDRGSYQLRLDEGVAPMSSTSPTRSTDYGNRRAADRTSSGYRY